MWVSAAAALAALSAQWNRLPPARWRRALATRRYPGPVVSLDPRRVRESGTWGG
jgi:hypothetical protein